MELTTDASQRREVKKRFADSPVALIGIASAERFEWPDPRESGILRLYRVVEGDGLPRVLVQRTEDGRPTASTLEIGHRIPLEGLGGFVAAEQFERSAVPSRSIEEVSDDECLRTGGGAEDDLLAAWAKVRVKGPWGEAEAELTPFEPPLFYGPPDRPALYSFGIYRVSQARLPACPGKKRLLVRRHGLAAAAPGALARPQSCRSHAAVSQVAFLRRVCVRLALGRCL